MGEGVEMRSIDRRVLTLDRPQGEGEPAELSTIGPKGANARSTKKPPSTRPRLRGRGEVALSGLARPKEGEVANSKN